MDLIIIIILKGKFSLNEKRKSKKDRLIITINN
jgi:hypothetical protein